MENACASKPHQTFTICPNIAFVLHAGSKKESAKVFESLLVYHSLKASRINGRNAQGCRGRATLEWVCKRTTVHSSVHGMDRLHRGRHPGHCHAIWFNKAFATYHAWQCCYSLPFPRRWHKEIQSAVSDRSDGDKRGNSFEVKDAQRKHTDKECIVEGNVREERS